MGETLPLFKTSFNHSVQVKSRPDHLTGEAGALIQREMMGRLGIIDWLDERMTDARNPERVTYPMHCLTWCAPTCCCLTRAGVIRMMPIACARIRPYGWPALFVPWPDAAG